MRTSITQNGSSVTISYKCSSGCTHSREFRVGVNGGYIRELLHGGAWQQIGEALEHSGTMLSCTPEQLSAVIRREWKKARAFATRGTCDRRPCRNW